MTLAITLETPDDPAARPGDTIEITARWSLEREPSLLEARLFWYTEGKGTQDIAIIERVPLVPNRSGKQRLKFRVPEGPYSFSGRLISLRWAVEVIADDRAERWEFAVGPDGREVRLGAAVPDMAIVTVTHAGAR